MIYYFARAGWWGTIKSAEHFLWHLYVQNTTGRMKLYKFTGFTIFVRVKWGSWSKVLNVHRKGDYQNRTTANKGEGDPNFGHFVII